MHKIRIRFMKFLRLVNKYDTYADLFIDNGQYGRFFPQSLLLNLLPLMTPHWYMINNASSMLILIFMKAPITLLHIVRAYTRIRY